MKFRFGGSSGSGIPDHFQSFPGLMRLFLYARSSVAMLLLMAGLTGGCAPSSASVEELAAVGIVDVEVEEAAELIANGDVVILDIRTPREYKAGHIPGAMNVDYRARDFGERLTQLDRDQTYVMHCAVGGRSVRALEMFKEHGFRNVHHLRSGFEGWKAAGNEVQQ
jgi:phage shock protein E